MTSFIKKYQPENLKDFGLEENTSIFVDTMLNIDKLNLLFVGDPDAGKTTILKCLVREYYKGYNEKEYSGNIINLNSAQEQGIHFYRNEVKTFCQTCSIIKDRKKIVIIDDLDLINQQSQQVFRNCIDNYNKNVHFICSCTNLKKIIESIQSRLVIVKIPAIDIYKLDSICKRIINNENIIIKDTSFDLFYKYCEKSLRIMINYLEKFKLYNNIIDNNVINSLCTNINDNIFDELILNLKNKNLILSIRIVKNIYNQGYSVMDILDCFFTYAKITNNLTDEEKYKIIPYICKYIHIFHDIHEDEIEIPLYINNIIKFI